MGREAQRCKITGDVFHDGRRHGYGCPHHSYIERGLTTAQVVSRIPTSSDYPYGGYCCNDCHAIHEPIVLPDSPGGSAPSALRSRDNSRVGRKSGGVGVAVCGASLLAIIFATNGLPWPIGVVVGAAVGYWWRMVLKIIVVVAVIGAVVALAWAGLKSGAP